MGKNRVHGQRREVAGRGQQSGHGGPPASAPADLAGLLQQGIGYHRQGQLAQAEAVYRRILEVAPEHPDALHLLGVMAHQVGRHEIALKLLDKAAELAPNSPVVHNNRGVTLKALRMHTQALESFDRAIALAPQGVDAHYNRGNTLREIKRYQEALESYEIALRLKPEYEYLDGARLFTKASIFDWDGIEEQTRRLEEQIGLGRKVADPFFVLGLSGSPVVQRQASEIYVRDKYHGGGVWPLPVRPKRERIRVGYFSPDFREHAVSYLTAEIFERHDRSQFEVVGFSFGPDTGDAMQKRVAAAMDRFVDVRAMSNAQIVQLSREMEIDIAVDLAGHTFGSRPEIFAERAAPIQINYLGHPGTMGGNFIDYLIGDEYLIPEASRAFYSEKIAYLPDCFQANDSRCAASERTFRRADEGLPEEGFVYCCFNSSYKITPAMFDVWMRILHRVEGSVLWLLDENPLVQPNLRREAEKRGIAPERLVFAGRLPLPEHMARQGLADVFLDTFPFNAGATASSAMWAGLPILTCAGEVFASRMAASLLRVAGLAELVTPDMAAYEEMAVRLAQEPGLMVGLRERLREARSSAPLFDVPRFTRDLEKAYCAMVERHQAGLGPDHLLVRGS